MITVDITMVIHIINMIVLMVVLNAILYKPVLGILEKRQEKLGALHNNVEQFEQLDGARSEAQAVGAEKLAAIRQESDGEKEKQLADIKSQVDGARKELLDNAAGFAQDMAGKILGRSLEA